MKKMTEQQFLVAMSALHYKIKNLEARIQDQQEILDTILNAITTPGNFNGIATSKEFEEFKNNIRANK